MSHPVGNSRKFDKRGNSTDRRNRKLWMLKTFAPLDDPTKVACVHCAAILTYEEVQADRIIPGGTYARTNVQPSCPPCNLARSDNANWVYVPAV